MNGLGQCASLLESSTFPLADLPFTDDLGPVGPDSPSLLHSPASSASEAVDQLLFDHWAGAPQLQAMRAEALQQFLLLESPTFPLADLPFTDDLGPVGPHSPPLLRSPTSSAGEAVDQLLFDWAGAPQLQAMRAEASV